MTSGPAAFRSWPTTLLVATAVILTVCVVVIAVVPLTPCRTCQIRNAYEETVWHEQRYQSDFHGGGLTIDPTVSPTRPPPTYCEDCRPTGKMTLLRKWLRQTRAR
jgi:hypothetical protein